MLVIYCRFVGDNGSSRAFRFGVTTSASPWNNCSRPVANLPTFVAAPSQTFTSTSTEASGQTKVPWPKLQSVLLGPRCSNQAALPPDVASFNFASAFLAAS